MSPFLFWCLVAFLTILLGSLLPKIIHFAFRIILYIIAFLLILWFFAQLGFLPSSLQDQWSHSMCFPPQEQR